MAGGRMTDVPLAAVAAQLRDEGLLAAHADEVDRILDAMTDVQPWYVRTMIGFGAWLASLLLIGFVAGIGINFDGGVAIIGLFFVALGVYLRRTSASDFAVQFALATSLAGQALLVIGVMEIIDWDEPEAGFALVIVMSSILFVVFPDRIHRVISILLATGSLTLLFYFREWNAFVPVLGPALAAGLVWITMRQAVWVSRGYGDVVRPLQSGLMLGAFGCLMMSTVYILPELAVDFQFYPRPWISTILLAALLVLVAWRSWSDMLSGASSTAVGTVYLLLAATTAAAWHIPGLLLALLVMLLGARTRYATMIGAGSGFLVLFVAAYFWGIQLTMLQKSATLAASGTVLVFASWLIGRLLPREAADV
jgi:hypothetical protein